MQNPGFLKDINIFVFDSARGIANGMITPSSPLKKILLVLLKNRILLQWIGNTPCQDISLIKAIIKSQKPFFNQRCVL